MTPVSKSARAALIPLFLVALGVVGIENALTRYFAVAKWSEYGYWIISIVMAGFALSGVVVALFRDTVERHGEWLRAALPATMVLAAALGYERIARNPFNPLQLQNPTTWADQLLNSAGYYGALLPFFFLAGLYIALIFILNPREIGRVYAYDLIGAGAGADVPGPSLPACARAAGATGTGAPVPARSLPHSGRGPGRRRARAG